MDEASGITHARYAEELKVWERRYNESGKEVADLREQVRQGQLRIVELQEQLAAQEDAKPVVLAPYASGPSEWVAGVTHALYAEDTQPDAPMQPASDELVLRVFREEFKRAGLDVRKLWVASDGVCWAEVPSQPRWDGTCDWRGEKTGYSTLAELREDAAAQADALAQRRPLDEPKPYEPFEFLGVPQ